MKPPWDDFVTASIDVDGLRSILIEGSLRAVVIALAKSGPGDRQRIVLAFPERRKPPFRMEGADISPLAIQLEIEASVERAQARNAAELGI